MGYTLEFFNRSVQDEVLGWPAGIAAGFARIALRMEAHGPDVGMPYTRPLGKGLFEVRAKGPEGIGRALFCTLRGSRIVVLHAFVKKTEKTPRREIEISLRRLKEVKHGR